MGRMPLDNPQHDFASRVTAFTQFLTSGGIGKRQYRFNDRLEFIGIGQLGDLAQLPGIGLGKNKGRPNSMHRRNRRLWRTGDGNQNAAAPEDLP